jgi:hypothetical protein
MREAAALIKLNQVANRVGGVKLQGFTKGQLARDQSLGGDAGGA